MHDYHGKYSNALLFVYLPENARYSLLSFGMRENGDEWVRSQGAEYLLVRASYITLSDWLTADLLVPLFSGLAIASGVVSGSSAAIPYVFESLLDRSPQSVEVVGAAHDLPFA